MVQLFNHCKTHKLSNCQKHVLASVILWSIFRGISKAQQRWKWGICCECGMHSHHRGLDPDCGINKYANVNHKGTRHCLKWDPQWFPTFIIGLGTMEFQIYVDISIGYGNVGTRLELSPTNLIAVNDDHTVIAKLEGDLLSYKQFPVFPNVYLSHPTNPTGINASEWLIIDRHKYSESGAVCDLIGTSYEAFTQVKVPCTKNVGFCLAYQLVDYVKGDYDRIVRGMKPMWSVAQYGAVQYSKNADNIEILLLPINQTQNSIVVLELSADTLEFVVSRSPGKIISVKSSKFEALSRNGYSEVTVVNIGELVAAFTLGLECPLGIQPSPAVSLSLPPNEPKTQRFDLNSETSSANSFNCSVRLRDSEGEITDAVYTYVSVSATKFSNVSKMQSEGAYAKLKAIDNGGGLLGWVGGALEGVVGLAKGVVGNAAKAIASMAKSAVTAMFGPTIGGLFGMLLDGVSKFSSWVLGGFGLGSLLSSSSFASKQCGCQSEYDVLCILSSFCFSALLSLFGFLLVVVGVVMSFVLLHRMGMLGPMVRSVCRCCPFPLRLIRRDEDGSEEESEEDEDSPNQYTNGRANQHLHKMDPIGAPPILPWNMMPSQMPYRFG